MVAKHIIAKAFVKQECIPVGCVPPAAVAVSPATHTPPPGMHAPPPVNRMTDACENITLPQTSFAGGKNM